jgi:hypothetical protein
VLIAKQVIELVIIGGYKEVLTHGVIVKGSKVSRISLAT